MKKDIFEYLIEKEEVGAAEIKKHFIKLTNKKIKEELKKLEDNDIITFDSKKKVYCVATSNFFITKILETKKGKPYIKINNKDIILNTENLKGAMPGHEVKIYNVNNNYYVKEVLNRSNIPLLLEVSFNQGEINFKHTNYVLCAEILVDIPKDVYLVDGDIIEVLPKEELYKNKINTSFNKIICNKKDPDAELKTLCANYGFRYEFSKNTLLELKKLDLTISDEEISKRIDLRNDLVISIDPVTAKDLDDAFSLEKTENGYILKTHIADVAHYVKYDSAIYKDAIMNSTSIYLGETVIPMLPQLISSGICSLHENTDRLVRTTEIHFDNDANVIDYKLYKSVINSKKKMNYDSVQDAFDGNIKDDYLPFYELLNTTKELALKLNKIRDSRGYLRFESNEINFIFDENNNIIDCQNEESSLSHDFIENIMVLTNSLKIQSFGTLPIIYRNHKFPDKNKIKNALEKLKDLDFKIEGNYDNDINKFLQNILKDLSKEDCFLVLSKVILTSFERAYYSTFNESHFGLNLDYYSHTTSPIRRIVDYAVQVAEDIYSNENLVDKDIEDLEKILIDISSIASHKEREATKVENKFKQIQMCKLLQDRIGEEFIVIISSTAENSFSVVAKGMTEGKVTLLNNDLHLYYNPTTGGIYDNNKNRYKIGHEMLVKLKSVDITNGDIEFIALDNLSIKSKRTHQRERRKK